MAKRGSSAAVLALAGRDYADLAERTLKALPEEVPVVRVDFGGDSDVAGLAGLVTALHVARGRGEAIGVDPGRPGIPEFGRKLFRLAPPRAAEMSNVVIERKRRAVERARGFVDMARLDQAYGVSRERLEQALIKGVVLDYDGTLCDARRRFEAMPEEMAQALERFIGLGLPLGVVTGRGKSVGAALRATLPTSVWERVRVGYYNGAECVPLADEDAPHAREPGELTEKVARVLESEDLGWKVEARAAQVTVTPVRRADMAKVVAEVAALIGGIGGMRLVTSSHSVDVLTPGVSKTRMIDEMERAFGVSGDDVLRIGDRGAAPGNDYELLQHPLGVSVDEVSADLQSCWRWSPAGYLGPRATLHYLSGLEGTSEGVRWRASLGDGSET
jgi:hydroxymethylpyrimidine pyrophosphatase-like HAD family hydrolase